MSLLSIYSSELGALLLRLSVYADIISSICAMEIRFEFKISFILVVFLCLSSLKRGFEFI